jgi:hypothetical protein
MTTRQYKYRFDVKIAEWLTQILDEVGKIVVMKSGSYSNYQINTVCRVLKTITNEELERLLERTTTAVYLEEKSYLYIDVPNGTQETKWKSEDWSNGSYVDEILRYNILPTLLERGYLEKIEYNEFNSQDVIHVNLRREEE